MTTTLQRTEALKRANQVRSVRAALKKTIAEQDYATGKLMALEAISNPPAEMDSMRIEDVLRSVKRMGLQKIRYLCNLAHVSPTRRLGELTDHERLRLEMVLR